jgi:hypothetical protein
MPLVVLAIFVCVLMWPCVATAGYTDSAHGDDTSGVFRQPVSVDFPLGADCTQWPGETCVGTEGSCAHCHDAFDSNFCQRDESGDYGLMLFADLDYDSQWDSFCISCHKGPSASYQVGMPNQYTYSVNRGGAPTGCPANIRGSFRFVKEDGTQRLQCGSTVGSSHFLGDIRSVLAAKSAEWGFDSDPANVNGCHACHNPHLATQEYPCSLPSDHWEVWGDEAGEKMINYATGGYSLTYTSPYLYPFPVGTEPPELYLGLPPPQPSEWASASAAPNYVSLCLDCHQDPVSSTRLSRDLLAINWENGDRHGKKGEPGSAPGSYGFGKYPYGSDYFETKYGFKVVMCTDCHDPHGSPNEFLLRTSVNGQDGLSVPGPGEWWNFCQACHFLTYNVPGGGAWHSSNYVCPDCHGHGNHTPFGEGF